MFTTERIRSLFRLLNDELATRSVRGELYLAEGAVMCLVFNSRPATKDIDDLLLPQTEMREAARAVAEREDLPHQWLNDAVKGFFSSTGDFRLFEELTSLRVYVPHPGYLLAMKCLALRMGEDFHDIDDVRTLIQALGLKTTDEAEAVLEKYYSLDRFPAKARYLLEEFLNPHG